MYAASDAVTNIKLDITSLPMTSGERKILTVAVEPSAAANQKVIWSSSNTDAAAVDDAGLVTAVGKGTAIITAKSADDPAKTAACTVTVGAAGVFMSMVELNKRLLPLMVGQHETLLAAVTLPPGANQAVTWSSSNPAVAAVNDTGLVSAAAEGTAAITVSIADDPFITAVCKVTVTITEPEIPAVTGVRLNKTALELGIYSNELGFAPVAERLAAAVEPWEVNQKVIWSSSNPSAAAVSDTGLVTAIGKGTAIITAKSVDDPAKTAACAVTVGNLFTGEPGMDY
ncbi:MAG: Ig-like domain-containing protein [Treponema sp.]|nr:Ig-like domain-containing protein [Treponema sp.]